MENTKKILVLNLGSTSTKVAVYEAEQAILTESVPHTPEDLKKYPSIFDQYQLRKSSILDVLKKHGISLDQIDCIATRGSNIKPIPGGIYAITPEMIEDAKCGKYGLHANMHGR